MNSLLLRKRELLMESDLNRQVLNLETQRIRDRISQLRGGLLPSGWKYVAPLVGVLFAWKFRRLGKFLTSSLGLFLLRKLWEGVVPWWKSARAPTRR